jgi:hypothetical protein
MEIIFLIGMIFVGVGFAMFMQWRGDQWEKKQFAKKYHLD